MKYKIFIDTNQVIRKRPPLEDPFGDSIPTLYSFLQENNIDNVLIYLPEIVIRERIQQRLENIQEYITVANEKISALQGIGHKTKEIKPLKNYKKILQKNVQFFIKKYNIQQISHPTIGSNELIDRAIIKMKPFNDNGAGFKDTLIFLSIVEDAKKEKEEVRYIFCTNDHKEFDTDVIEEFRKETGKELYMVPSIVKVTEKLDELIPLNRHLEERNKRC